MVKKTDNLILIDGNNLLYRFFYALPPFSTTSGEPVGALFGFTRMLLKLLKNSPTYFAIIWDSPKPNLRYTLYPEYKAQRPPTPDSLNRQRVLIKEILSAFAISSVEVEGEEADDVIAYLAREASRAGVKTTIYSGDKDLLQLINNNIHLHMLRKGISDIVIYTEEKVLSDWGIKPEQFKDLKILLGDPSDNVRGLNGVGEKSALELIRKYGSLEGIYQNLNDLSEKQRKLFQDNQEYLKIVTQVIELNYNLNTDLTLADLTYVAYDYKTVLEAFDKYEFKSLLKEIKPVETKIDLFNLPEGNLFSPKNHELTYSGNRYLLLLEFAEKHPLSIYPSKAILGNPEKPVLIEGAYLLSEEFTHRLGEVLSKDKLEIITANYKNLLHYLKLNNLPQPNNVQDISLLLHLYDPLSQGELPFQENFDYLNLTDKLLTNLLDSDLINLYEEVEKPLCEVISLMEKKGIAFDSGQLEVAKLEAYEKIKILADKAYALAGTNFNLNSPRQVAEILFEKLKLPAAKKGKTGFSTSIEVLKSLERYNPIVPLIIEYREVGKLISTYLEALPKYVHPKTGRIHTNFSQIGTSTGRLSSKDPNLQNIPTRSAMGNLIRTAFVPRKGKMFISGDYSQIELRVLAHLSKDPSLLQAFVGGEDIHSYTASLLFNTLPAEVSKEERNRAKTVNFGLIYGMSDYGLSQELNLPRSEAKQFINRYFLRFPGVKNYFESHLEECKKTGYTRTIFGRKRNIPDINSDNRIIREQAYRIAINTPIQGTAADIIKKAMVNFHKIEVENGLKETNLLLQIHDDLLIEVPESEQSYWIEVLQKSMEEVIDLLVPIKVNISCGYNWGEMKSYQ